VRFRLDDSGASIGRRYARTDEIGIPFGITVDKDTLTDDAATVRDCITTSQVRIKVGEPRRGRESAVPPGHLIWPAAVDPTGLHRQSYHLTRVCV